MTPLEVFLAGLWRSAWGILPVALLAVITTRWLAARPATRHWVWVSVLGWMVVGGFLPAYRGPAPIAPMPPIAATPAADQSSAISDQSRAISDQSRAREEAVLDAPPAELAIADDPISPVEINALRTPSADPSDVAVASQPPQPLGIGQSPTETVALFEHESSTPAPSLAAIEVAVADLPTDSLVAESANLASTADDLSAARPDDLPITQLTPPATAVGTQNDPADCPNTLVPNSAQRVVQSLESARQRWQTVVAALRSAAESLPAPPPWAWLIGGAAFAAWVGVQLLAAKARSRGDRPAPRDVQRCVAAIARKLRVAAPETVMSERAVSPHIWCAIRPRLVLPRRLWADLDRDGRHAVVCHELAHLSRRDHWVRRFELAATALFWWHPILWWVRQRIAEEADLSCDAWVTWLAPRKRRAYAEALLRAQSACDSNLENPSLAVGLLTKRSQKLARRLTMVMTQSARPQASLLAGVWASMLLLTGWVTLPAWACPPEEKKPHSHAHAPAPACASIGGGAASAIAPRVAVRVNTAGDDQDAADENTYSAYFRAAGVQPYVFSIAGAPKDDEDEEDEEDENGDEDAVDVDVDIDADVEIELAEAEAALADAEAEIEGGEDRIQEMEAQLRALEAQLRDMERSMRSRRGSRGGSPPAPHAAPRAPMPPMPPMSPMPAAPGVAPVPPVPPTPPVVLVPRHGSQNAPRVARMRSTGGGDGPVLDREYCLPAGKRDALYKLMVRDDVAVRVSRHGDCIGVSASERQHAAINAFVEMIRGEWQDKSYRLPKGKLEDFAALMSRDDVPIKVSGADDALNAEATPAQHEIIAAFLEVIQPGSNPAALDAIRERHAMHGMARAHGLGTTGPLAMRIAERQAGKHAARDLERMARELRNAERQRGRQLEAKARQLRNMAQQQQNMSEQRREQMERRREEFDARREELQRHREKIREHLDATPAPSESKRRELEAEADAVEGNLAEYEAQLEAFAEQLESEVSSLGSKREMHESAAELLENLREKQGEHVERLSEAVRALTEAAAGTAASEARAAVEAALREIENEVPLISEKLREATEAAGQSSEVVAEFLKEQLASADAPVIGQVREALRSAFDAARSGLDVGALAREQQAAAIAAEAAAKLAHDKAKAAHEKDKQPKDDAARRTVPQETAP